jgi:hypothetical protein
MTTGDSLRGGIRSFYPAWPGQPGWFTEVRAGHNAAVAQAGVDWFAHQVFTRTSVGELPSHLRQQYGVDVTELDVGVYRVG